MPDRPQEPLTPQVPTSVTCPGCGVDVAVGYPRCPRCHASVPQPGRPRRQTFREMNLAGGTSVEPEDTGRGGFLVIALAGFAAILLVVWLATRDGDDDARPATADDDLADDEPVDDVEPGQPVADDTPDLSREEPDEEDLMPAALADLDEALRAAQMWSKVRRSGDVVVVESSLCEDGDMWSAIAPLAAQLRDAGATAVRCQAPHGGVVFERAL